MTDSASVQRDPHRWRADLGEEAAASPLVAGRAELEPLPRAA